MWYTIIFRQVTCLKELMDLMHDVNAISRDWSVWADMVSFAGEDAILICRYTGSWNFEAGKTELARMLDERDWTRAAIDDAASQAVNRVDGAIS